MNFIIFYFSGTGNTELISKEIKKKLETKKHNVELVSIEDKERLEHIPLEDKIIGFGFPVYKFSYPDIFNQLFSFLNESGRGNQYFQFSTFARFTSESFYNFSRQLNKKQFYLIAEESFKAPSCGISARKPETDFEYKSVMFFEDNINKKLDAFVDRILCSIDCESITIKHRHNIFNKLKLKIVKDIEATKYPKLEIDKDNCIRCGLCSKKCPDENLVFQGNNIQIKDDANCLHCLRCMNHCPSNAITFGLLTVGDNRYTVQLRDRLFQKAVAGNKEPHWQNFQEIILQWRRSTIRYWWKNRRNPL